MNKANLNSRLSPSCLKYVFSKVISTSSENTVSNLEIRMYLLKKTYFMKNKSIFNQISIIIEEFNYLITMR